MGVLGFRVLGPVEALRDGEPIALGRGVVPNLLAGFLMRPNQALPADSLIEMLWDAKLPEHPRAALASGLSRLRRLIGSQTVETLPEGYRLHVTTDQLDLLQFDELTAAARTWIKQEAYEEAVASLEQAIALWRKPLWSNADSAVLHRDVLPDLVERYLEAQEERAELCLLLGRHADVLSELAALAREHPFRERIVGQLMLALYRSGRQADAVAAYGGLRETLNRELGIYPGPALKDLYVEILRADPGLGSSRPAPAELAQETAPGPLPERLSGVPHVLPAVMGPLYGREHALSQLDRWFAASDGGPLLVSIVGPGGIGKTLWDTWIATHETGLVSARRCRSRMGEMYMLDGLGSIYLDQGQWREAVEFRLAALALAQAEDNRHREAGILGNLGVAYYAGEDYERSLEYLLQSQRIMEELGETPDRASVLNNIGELLNSMDRHAEAVDYLHRGLAVIKHSAAARSFGSLMNNLGVAHAGLGDHDRAIEHFLLALDHSRHRQNRALEALNLLYVGDTLARKGDRDAALGHWRASMDIYTDLNAAKADQVRARIEAARYPAVAVNRSMTG